MVEEVDDIIIDRVIRGDQSAFRAVINRYRDFAYTIAIRIVNNAEDAEEVTQDSFVKAYQHLKNFNRNSKLSTWLYRITYNTAVSKLRKKRLQQQSIHEVEDYKFPVDQFENAFFQLHNEEQKHFLQQALAKLSTEEQTLLTLYYLQENSIEEVSKVVGLNTNNVKVKIHRARKKLYNLLTKDLKDELRELL